MKFPKQKKVKKKTLRNHADKLFSKHIRSIGHCQAEGRTKVKCGGQLQCAHLITRSNIRLRYEEYNVLCLCAGHHRYWTHRPLEWSEFLLTYYNEKHHFVMKHRNEKTKKTEELYRSIIEKYKEPSL